MSGQRHAAGRGVRRRATVRQIPPGALSPARYAILDSLGVALGSSQDDVGRIGAELARDDGAREVCRPVWAGFRSSATNTGDSPNSHPVARSTSTRSFAIIGQPIAADCRPCFALADRGGQRRQTARGSSRASRSRRSWPGPCPSAWSRVSWHATAPSDRSAHGRGRQAPGLSASSAPSRSGSPRRWRVGPSVTSEP